MGKKQCKVVLWDDIKHNPPKQLNISPLAMIPHKSRMFRAILDLSFNIRLKSGEQLMAVNESSEKTAPKGAIDQLGHSLQRIIHARTEQIHWLGMLIKGLFFFCFLVILIDNERMK